MFKKNREFQKLQIIGSGEYGKVYMVRKKDCQDQNIYAMKIILNNNHNQTILSDKILTSLDHPNIIKLYDNYEFDDQNILIMEYAQKGDLLKYINNNSFIQQQLIINWIAQISLGLQYLHNQMNIIHRDIKLQNILIMDNGLIKLADFGISTKLQKQHDFASTTIGTPCYLSPQMIERRNYNYKTDIWGFGCLLYELCTKQKPFTGQRINQLIQNILNQKIKPLPSTYSSWLKQLITKMLSKDPKERPQIRKILQLKQIQKALVKLKQIYPVYKTFINLNILSENPKTTKYFQRQQYKQFNMPLKIAECLKTAKHVQKNQKGTKIEDQTKIKQSYKQKIDQRFFNRSLKFLVSQKRKEKNL